MGFSGFIRGELQASDGGRCDHNGVGSTTILEGKDEKEGKKGDKKG